MNLSDDVRVKMTKEGMEVLGAADGAGRVDEDGYLECKLWTLMQVFGPHIHMGMTKQFFESNEIELVEEPVLGFSR